jgi:micrococcal nuclease
VRGTRRIRSAWFVALVAAFVLGCGGATSSPTATLVPATPRSTSNALPTTTPVDATATPATLPNADGPTGPTKKARVIDVVDGDTIRVRLDGVDYPVRYIGIDAPERDEPLFRESSQANDALVANKRVWLEKDTSDTDKYDRLLRHVWVKDGAAWLLVDEELVRLGLAEAKTYPPDTKYDQIYFEAQDEAQNAGVGLWADEQAFFDPGPAATTPPARPTKGPRAGNRNCDPSYPDVCIPPYPPDLDCADVSPLQDIRVVGSDPHGFDGNDNDGWGCES